MILISDLYRQKIPLSSLSAFTSLPFPPVQQKRADKLWFLSVPILYGKMKSKEMDERIFFRQSVIKEQNAKCSKFSVDEDEISTHV